MRIEVIVEGATEKAFLPILRDFLREQIAGELPSLRAVPQNGRVPKGEKLNDLVSKLLINADHVIALADVYPDYTNAAEARSLMRRWVRQPQRFHPHAAQYEFEAWLLPYWDRIREISGHNQSPPGSNPETINSDNPPSHRIREVFRRGQRRFDYVKARDASRILRGQNLSIAVDRCPELKSLVNTILDISGGQKIP